MLFTLCVPVCCSAPQRSSNHGIRSVSATRLPVTTEPLGYELINVESQMLILNLEGLLMVPKYVMTKSEINKDLHSKMGTAFPHGQVNFGQVSN